jgi:hypothetical protein
LFVEFLGSLHTIHSKEQGCLSSLPWPQTFNACSLYLMWCPVLILVSQLHFETSKISTLDKVCDVLLLFEYHISPTNVTKYVTIVYATTWSHTWAQNRIL